MTNSSLTFLQSKRSLLGAALLLAALVPACAVDASSDDDTTSADVKRTPTTVQMNDVSILYPLATSASDIDNYLSPTSKGAGGQMLPSKIFDAIATQVQGIDGAPQIDDLHVIAARLDPCFAQIGPVTDPSSCSHMIRLVYQSVMAGTTKGAPVTVADSGFHVFYSLTADQFDAALKEIVNLRVANSDGKDLGALTVHPIMKSQGLSGAYAQGLNAIIQKYAGAGNIIKITGFLGVFSQHTSWNFAASDVANGKPTVDKIASLADDAVEQTVSLGTAPTDLIQLGFLQTTTNDNVQPLLTAVVQDDTDAVRQAAFDSALRVENPNFNSPNTIDCASCHTAEIARQLIGQDFFKLSTSGDANAFVSNSKYVTKTDTTTKYLAKQPNGLAVNLHAFSYDGTDPMIILRVINETAAIVAALNGPPTK
ncbi:MAG: hypothetical protein ABI421_05400 [Polyangiaceae bacterium]